MTQPAPMMARGRGRTVAAMALLVLASVLMIAAHSRQTRINNVLSPPAALAPIDLNTAGAAELSLLPGIGPMLAKRIIAERIRRGGFTSIEELDGVDGVGAATIVRIHPFVRPLLDGTPR